MLTEPGGTAIYSAFSICNGHNPTPSPDAGADSAGYLRNPAAQEFRWYNRVFTAVIVRRLLIFSIEVMADGNQVQPHVIKLAESFGSQNFSSPDQNL
jgi:hypothetical protein